MMSISKGCIPFRCVSLGVRWLAAIPKRNEAIINAVIGQQGALT